MNAITARRLLLAGARISWATALLWSPRRVIQAAGGAVDERSRTTARILGSRHAVQAAIELATWPRWRKAGSVVDTLHAATAAGLAGVDRQRRRLALADTGVAAAFALLGASTAGR